MSLSGIRIKIDEALDGIDGLNHAAYAPSVYVPPFAFPALRPVDTVDYDFTAHNATLIYHFYVEILVNKGATLEQAQDELDKYILPAGDYSIKTAIEAIDWDGEADTCRVMGVTNYGPARYGESDYLAARLGLDIWVTV